LVSILAYAAGEEDFVDLNFDNAYTPGEPFTDLGNAFRADAALVGGVTGPYVAGYFSVPRAGSTTCSGGFLGRPNSCDGVWGAADVRQQAVVAFATGQANITGTLTPPTLALTVSDLNGNSVPTGSVIQARTSSISCGLDGSLSTVSKTVPNSIGPFATSYGTSVGCATGDQVIITVTTPAPLSTVTTRTFVFP